jgi:hypothetical protein
MQKELQVSQKELIRKTMKVGDIINIVFQHGGSELMEKIEAELEQ